MFSIIKKLNIDMKPFPCQISFLRLVTISFLVFSGRFTTCNADGSRAQQSGDTDTLLLQDPLQNLAQLNLSFRTDIKICAWVENLRNLLNEIHLPTFNSKTLAYTLERYSLNQSLPLQKCPGGQHFEPNVVNILSLAEYGERYVEERIFDVGFDFDILRSASMIFHGGYLSVGSVETLTAVYFSPEEYCLEATKGTGHEATAAFRVCPPVESRPVIRKCCPLGMFLDDVTCVASSEDESHWDPHVLDAGTMKLVTLEEANPVIESPKLFCTDDNLAELWANDGCSVEFHPLTDSRTAFIGPYRTWEFFPADKHLCLESLHPENESERIVMIYCPGNDTEVAQNDINFQLKRLKGEDHARVSIMYMITTYTGAFFHLMTTCVYMITWSHQNIHGRVLCSCTTSLFFMKVVLGTVHALGEPKFLQNSALLCTIVAVLGQFFMIAAFNWLLIINFKLWRTFRKIKSPSTGRQSLGRFFAYSLFGWGFPLLVVIVSVCLQEMYSCRTSRVPVPEYGKHYYCFISPWAQGYYIYYILSILISLSFFFAALTFFGVHNMQRGRGSVRSTKESDDKQNILLFLKLSLVMGLTWAFEVIGWAVPLEAGNNHAIWILIYILDMYNVLSALLIFIFFVCKRSTWSLLEKTMQALKSAIFP